MDFPPPCWKAWSNPSEKFELEDNVEMHTGFLRDAEA
jgi:hypothetical protein